MRLKFILYLSLLASINCISQTSSEKAMSVYDFSDSLGLSRKCFVGVDIFCKKKLKTTVIVTNEKGTKISEYTLKPNQATQYSPDTLAKGVYYVKAYDKNGFVWGTEFVTKGYIKRSNK